MYNYSIMHLDTDHIDEICEDIRRQYEEKIADCALFCMALVPEGDPDHPGKAIDKAAIFCEKFDLFRDRLESMGLKCGILAQCTIGHGYPLNNLFPFTPYAAFTDGQAHNVCCPYDEAFREHMKGQFATLAAHRPAMIMVDDDFRLMNRGAMGCACSLHLDAIAGILGYSLTREELWDAIFNKDDETVRDAFVKSQRDSLLGAARAYRAGIDSVDPAIPGAFCICGNNTEFGTDIARILCGKGNPVIIRVNNGRYHPAGARDFTSAMYRAASQAALLKGADVILAETDTCPQNRYSTSAHSLHTHFVGTILEGASGAKHWLTRSAFEPESGEAYRRLLAKNSGLYQALADLLPRLKWLGCRIPVPMRPEYLPAAASGNGWITCVLERLGFPMYFSAEAGGALFLDGSADSTISDEELLEAFRGPVFLSSEAAARLIARGFGKYIGVDVRPWTGKHPSGELIDATGCRCNVQMKRMELVPLSDSVRSHSTVFHVPDGKTKEPLFPGVTSFVNELGGTTVTFCGTPKAKFHYLEAFSFLNYSRKQQMAELLCACGQLPVWYTGDTEIYLRAADIVGSEEQLVAVFNISLDPLDEIDFGTDREITSVERLCPDGSRAPCTFWKTARGITVDAPAPILDPVILFLK